MANITGQVRTLNKKIRIGILIISLWQTTAWGEISTSLEPVYSEAVLAYNGRDYNRALLILNNLMKEEPEVPEFMELKALLLKTTQDEKGSAALYDALIRLRTREGKSPQEIAPYHFELGLLQFRAGRYSESKVHFESAIQADVNTAPAHYFLGLMDLKREDWRNSERHFRHVANSDLDDLRPVAYLYLGQIYLKQGISSAAVPSFSSAFSEAKTQLSRSDLSEDRQHVLEQVYHSAEEALKVFDRSGFFGSIALMTASDSNVLVLGSGVAGVSGGSSTPTGAATLKETALLNVGYSSSALNAIQFVPSYRTSMNLNFNTDTLNGEYFVHDFSLYMTKGVFQQLSYGLKVEGTYTLQDQPSSSNARNFSPYTAIGSFGPYVRYLIRPKLALSVEGNYSPQKFYTDDNLDATSSNRRSGTDYNLRVSLKNDRNSKFWNPGVSLYLDYNNTVGTEFNSYGATAELNDVMHLSEKLHLFLAGDLGLTSYSRSPNPSRTDKLITVSANPVYRLGPRYSLLGEFQYTQNYVSCDDSQVVDTYQYSRFIASIGISYTF